jgi:hydroxymethylglutaryl-CoA reductase
VTIGIQEGHMKMHLFNIMKQLNVPDIYKNQVIDHFKHAKVSVSAVRKLAEELTIGTKTNVAPVII